MAHPSAKSFGSGCPSGFLPAMKNGQAGDPPFHPLCTKDNPRLFYIFRVIILGSTMR
jgi:hypothetical protein